MKIYETVFMMRQDLSETQVKQLTDKYTAILTDNGGKILKTEQWGLRPLAYAIRKNRRAHYVLIESEAPGAAVIELERLLRLDEDVLRSLTVKLDAASTEPSAPISRSSGPGTHSSSREAA
ncbi:MAG: 30S ribosomal protein S6 [Alphaproteobacteria bacterium]|nr:30S ribosomal protein S6 [Alphaproteobacteria bacterium]